MIGLWANFALTLLPEGDPKAASALEQAAVEPGPTAELAALLRAVGALPLSEREARLDDASAWLRRHHPQAAKIWHGWNEVDGRIIQVGTQ